jgi:hypothetical protein
MKIEDLRDPKEITKGKGADYKFLDLDKKPINDLQEFSGVIVYEINDFVEESVKWIIRIDALEGKIVQKYSVLHFPEIRKFLERSDCVDTAELKDLPLLFKRKKFNIGYDRFIPVKFLKK